MHWGPSQGYVILSFASNNIFAIQAQHYCKVCANFFLALSRIVTRNLWRENDPVVQAALVEDDDPEVF